MSADPTSAAREPILAAGGIVVRSVEDAPKICLVRRHRYPGEIALPKGKLRTGETAIEAAQREVSEETGCEVAGLEYAGSTHYLVKNVPKAVFYFVMQTDSEGGGPNDTEEIENIEWLTPRDALLAVTHAEERNLISAVFGLREIMAPRAAPSSRFLFGSPDRDRLAGEISEAWIDLDKQIMEFDEVQGNGSVEITKPWARAAYQLLLQSRGIFGR